MDLHALIIITEKPHNDRIVLQEEFWFIQWLSLDFTKLPYESSNSIERIFFTFKLFHADPQCRT